MYPTNLRPVNKSENGMLIRTYLIKESTRSKIEKCTGYKINNITSAQGESSPIFFSFLVGFLAIVLKDV